MRHHCWTPVRRWIWISIFTRQVIVVAQATKSNNLRGNKFGSAISITNFNNEELDMILSESSSLPGKAIVSKMLDDTNMSANNRIHNNIQQQYIPTNDASDPNTSIDIPYQFKSDQMYVTNEPQPFPRWNVDDKDPNLVIDSIIEFLTYQNDFYQGYLTDPYYSTANTKLSPFILDMHYTSDHPKGVINHWRPETLYIVTSDGVYCSTTAKNITDRWCPNRSGTTAMLMTENIMARAYNQFVSVASQSQHRWPSLYQKIIQDKSSLPFLAHYSDYKGCNYHNWNDGKSSIPLYTVAASMDCYNTFPFPNSRTGRHQTRSNESSWDRTFKRRRRQYKDFNTRIPQIVWRGSLTGIYNETIRPPRYHLLKLVHSKQKLTATEREMFDIKLSSTGPNADRFLSKEDVELYLGGISKAMKMEDFQKYKAILDIDGHSWSSRFGDLLCFNSVVMKVEPEWVDYFYYPKNTSLALVPWKHYIPIQRNLTDLVEKAKYVLDPKSEAHMLEIISNAQQWCQMRMLDSMVAEDALDIWEYNVQLLNDNDPSWSTKWNRFVSEQSNLIPQPSHTSEVDSMKHPQQMTKINELVFLHDI